MKKIILLLTLVSFLFTANSQIRYLKGILNSSQEVPANASSASGIVIVKLNTTTNAVEVFGDYAGLSTTITGAHIHLAPAGSNGGVIVALTYTGGTTGVLSGTGSLTAPQATDMLNGNTYINVHSTTYGGGEIRAQLSPTTDMQTLFFNSRIQGAQQVPPNSSTATGWANVLLDKTKDSVFVTGFFTGLSSSANAAHLHTEYPGSNGVVLMTLFNTASTSGAIHVANQISAFGESEMIDGGIYINIHTSTYPGGEIRGQVNRFSQQRFFKGLLQSSQEVPPNTSPATGTILALYNPETKDLEISGDYQNLMASATAAHVHSPALPGNNAGVLFPLSFWPSTIGTLDGSETLTAAQETDLFDGKMYVNLHTSAFPGGEVRAQLTSATPGQSQILLGNLEGSQEVPANASTADGYVSVILDKITNEVFLSGVFSGLVANATAAHIHQAAAGVNGPVVVTLNVNAGTSGTINGSATVTQAVADAMIAGNTYVNIHNTTFPGGELRAQLGNYTLPVVLTYFKGYKERNQVALVWEVAQEVNFSRYEIEQQNTETGKWILRSSVSSKGENGRVSYKQNDMPLTFKGEYVIYRLKMIDKDGQFKYSPVVKINFRTEKNELLILGNPVTNNELRMILTGDIANENGDVSIIDLSGKILKKAIAKPGMALSINISDLSSGMYYILVNVNGEVLKQTFIK